MKRREEKREGQQRKGDRERGGKRGRDRRTRKTEQETEEWGKGDRDRKRELEQREMHKDEREKECNRERVRPHQARCRLEFVFADIYLLCAETFFCKSHVKAGLLWGPHSFKLNQPHNTLTQITNIAAEGCLMYLTGNNLHISHTPCISGKNMTELHYILSAVIISANRVKLALCH